MNDQNDPRGLIAESYRMEGISAPECRSIFLDWALEPRDVSEMHHAARALLARFAPLAPNHPMTGILQEAEIEFSTMPKRRGGRKAR